jgi:hypothetical protein
MNEVAADPKLVAQGWTRRHLCDAVRAREWIELYATMGYEVKATRPTPSDYGPACSECALASGDACVLIYTRKKGTVRGSHPMSPG